MMKKKVVYLYNLADNFKEIARAKARATRFMIRL